MTSTRPLAGKSVLVVEDDYFLARDACEWLIEAGAQIVGPVPNIERALQLMSTGVVDAAVIDINLGQGPTYEVAAKLSERAVPFVFATGYDQAAIPPEFQDRPRLEKPFSGKQLVGVVRALG
jgi:DNA-binding LytR/AlgR family response regulator